MITLRSKLIRLAHNNPELRADLLPILRRGTAEKTSAGVLMMDVKKWLTDFDSSKKEVADLAPLLYALAQYSNLILHDTKLRTILQKAEEHARGSIAGEPENESLHRDKTARSPQAIAEHFRPLVPYVTNYQRVVDTIWDLITSHPKNMESIYQKCTNLEYREGSPKEYKGLLEDYRKEGGERDLEVYIDLLNSFDLHSVFKIDVRAWAKEISEWDPSLITDMKSYQDTLANLLAKKPVWSFVISGISSLIEFDQARDLLEEAQKDLTSKDLVGISGKDDPYYYAEFEFHKNGDESVVIKDIKAGMQGGYLVIPAVFHVFNVGNYISSELRRWGR